MLNGNNVPFFIFEGRHKVAGGGYIPLGESEPVGTEFRIFLLLVDIAAMPLQRTAADGSTAENKFVFPGSGSDLGEISLDAVGKAVADHKDFQLFC